MGHKAYAPRWFLPATSEAFKTNYDEIFKKKPKKSSKEARTETPKEHAANPQGARPGQGAG